MHILITISILILILTFVIFSIYISKIRMKRELIKIEKAKGSIIFYLNKMKELLYKTGEYLSDSEDILDYQDINFKEVGFIRENEVLTESYQKIKQKIFEDEELQRNKDFMELMQEINDHHSNLFGSIKFYNDSIEKYYDLKNKFPSNFVKFFCGFKTFDTIEIKKTRKIY